MKKIYLIAALLLFAASLNLDGSDSVRNFELGHVKIPVYQKGKLDFIIFAARGQRNGNTITGTDTLIDRLLQNANVDLIPDGWQTGIYPLRSPLPAVLNFWQKRFDCSEAVLFTPECRFDRKTNIVQGNDEVMMRTPTFDLDGIGFRADLNKKELEIRSDVEIVTRRDDSDPREIITKRIPVPRTYSTVSATGDSLRLDMLHNEIMLIGNVKVIDGTTTLNCDRLTVFLKSAGNTATAKRETISSGTSGDSTAMLKGISRILADGEVTLTRKPDNDPSPQAVQRARAEHLEYEFDSGRIILTGEDELPQLAQDNYTIQGSRIELLSFSNKAFVKGNCRIAEYPVNRINNAVPSRVISSDQADFDGVSDLNIFTGNVKVTDNDATLTCSRMQLFLKKSATGKTPVRNAEFSPISGTRELQRIFCEGKVRIVSHPKPGQPANMTSTVNSLRAELDYAADKLVFYDKVKVNHKGDTLDCDRLDLFLKNSAYNASGKNSSGGVALGGRASNDKTLSKVIASGNVAMKDKQSDLATELMTLDFKELPPGTRSTPGMFASNNVQLIRITCDGKVVAGSFPGTARTDKVKKRLLKAEHAMTDLLKNRSEFHKEVFIQEDNNTLTCRDMYVFTGAAPAATVPAAKKPKTDDPDADPFALDMSENSAPSRIALSDGLDLERIVCKNEVILTNKDAKGNLTYAGGDTAVYTVKTGDLVISAEPPQRPYMRRDGRIQYSDIIRGNLQTEELFGSGNVQVVPDKSFKSKDNV